MCVSKKSVCAGILLFVQLAATCQIVNKPGRLQKKKAQRLETSGGGYDTIRLVKPARVSFINRFQTDGTQYQQQYDQRQAKAQQQRCQLLIDARQTKIDQLALINRLVSQSDVASLTKLKRENAHSIIDTLMLGRTGIQFLRLDLQSGFDAGCHIPQIDTSGYQALQKLRLQGRLEILGMNISEAMIISPLPGPTDNVETASGKYLKYIRELLVANYSRLKTSYSEYLVYETTKIKNLKMKTPEAILNFRKEFCCAILCDINAN